MSQPPMQSNFASAGYTGPQATSGLAIASLVLGIVSLFFCIWYIALPAAVLAIIFGVIANGQIRRGEAGGGGFARAGIIMGCIGITLDIIAVVLVFTIGVAFLHFAKNQQQKMQQQQMQSNPSPAPATPTTGE